MRWCCLVLLLCFGSSAKAHELSPFAWLASWLLPDGFHEGYEVRAFIDDPLYDSIRAVSSDRETLDALYQYAYSRTNGDERSAAFAMLVAVFEHRTIPMKIGIDLPLSFEEKEAFERRVNRLPRYLYDDTTDDRDKLQHFFSAAYAKRTFGMSWLVDLLGQAIEGLEEKLVEGGANDRRDIVANRDGIRFGVSRDRLPSAFLTK